MSCCRYCWIGCVSGERSRAFDVVAHALIWAGRRADLDRLRQVAIDADPAEVRKILDRTTFQVCRRRLR